MDEWLKNKQNQNLFELDARMYIKNVYNLLQKASPSLLLWNAIY